MHQLKTTELIYALKNASKEDLRDFVDQNLVPELVEEINQMLLDKKMTKGDLLRKTTLDRTYGYQVLSGMRKGSRDKIIQITRALELDHTMTNRFLNLSHHATLYPKINRDAILIFGIHHNLSVMELNYLLDQHDEACL